MPSSSNPASSPLQLAPIIVSAPRIPSAIEGVPSAVSVVEMEEVVPGKPLLTLFDPLSRVPGVQVSNRLNFAQDLRVSIRGFGARSAFGIRGIQILVDGLPYTLPDGQSQIDDIDPEAIERIEVLRGPIAALYGNSSGGVINLLTREGSPEPSLEAAIVTGDFGLVKTVLQAGGQADRTSGFLTLSRLQIEGIRDHSEAESWKMFGKVRVDLDDVSDATFSVSLLDSPKLQDPGGLDRQQAEDDPRQAAPLSLRFDTGEEVSQQRVGLVYRRAMTLNQNLEALAYYGARRLDSAIPFRFIDLDREFFGAGIKYDRTLELLGLSHRWFIGADLQRQIDDRRNFDNQGGAPGETLLLDQKEEVTSLGVYLQDEIRLSKKWSLVAGGRFDSVNFDIDDHLRADGDDSGTRDFHQTTGRIGVTWLPRPDWQLYTSIAQSFETPTATEVVNRPQGGGGINPDIEPQKAISYEIGLKGLGDGPFTCSLALFHIRLEDELIAFRDPTDRVFYRNAGESRRNGLELGLKRDITEGFEINLAYTYLDAEFDSYEKNGLDLNGNQVPGLPKHQVFGEIVYEHPSGFYAALESLWVGESYADDENTVKSERFVLVNLRTGVTKNFGRWRISPFLGAENLLDESYSSNVRINASGGRYFEPGPGVNLYGGIRIAYLHD